MMSSLAKEEKKIEKDRNCLIFPILDNTKGHQSIEGAFPSMFSKSHSHRLQHSQGASAQSEVSASALLQVYLTAALTHFQEAD